MQRKESQKIIVSTAILSFGIPTVIINAFILFFTLPAGTDQTLMALKANFCSVAIGCGIMVPWFGGLTLKGVLKKHPSFEMGCQKSQLPIARWLPKQCLLGSLVIGLYMVLVYWLLPFIVLWFLPLSGMAMGKGVWLGVIAVYAGLVAANAGYFGLLRAYFSQ